MEIILRILEIFVYRHILTNLQDKNSFSRILIYLFSNSIINYAILFLISILIFRNVDKSDYGLYIVLMSIFAMLELFMGGYNQSIARYLKEKISQEDKQQIILYAFYYKYLLLIIFLLILFILNYSGFSPYIINNYTSIQDSIHNYIVIAALNTIVSIMLGISTVVLTSLYHYRFVTFLSILKNLIYLLCVVGLIFFTNEYLIYLYVNLLVTIVLLVILSLKIIKEHKEYSFLCLIQIRFKLSIYKKYLHSYATPLTMTSLLTYVKNHLPIIILGKEFELETVAVFSILKNFFKALHTLAGSFIGSLTSKFVEMKNDQNKFKKVLNSIYYGTLIVRIFIYIIMIVFIEYLFIIYNLENSYINKLLVFILGIEFIVAGMMTVYGTLLSLKTDTKKLFYTSLGRFFLECILIYFFLFEYGILGAALILLLSRYFETILAYLFIRKEKVLKFTFISLLVLLLFIYYFLVIVFI